MQQKPPLESDKPGIINVINSEVEDYNWNDFPTRSRKKIKTAMSSYAQTYTVDVRSPADIETETAKRVDTEELNIFEGE